MPSFWWENDPEIENIWEQSTEGITADELADFGLTEDGLRSIFEHAFIDMDISSDLRSAYRDLFFDYLGEMGYEISDFDWDDWRDWYDSQ